MRVRMEYRTMPGPKQITAIELRIDTADPVQAITDAMSYSTTTSTIPIARIVIDLDLDQTEKE